MLKLIGSLTVCALLFFLLGWALGWFNVATASGSRDPAVKIGVDSDKVERDTASVREGAQNIARKIESAVKGSPEPESVRKQIAAADEVLRGELVALEGNRLDLRVDAGTLQVSLDDATDFYRDGEVAARDDLRTGDELEVAIETDGETRQVILVRATSNG